MRWILIGAGALALPAAGAAVGAEPGSAACYIEVARLMADPPRGIGDLGAAIRRLDETLRPQVEEIKRLKEEIARLEQRQAGGVRLLNAPAEAFGEPPREADEPNLDRVRERMAETTAELDAKQAQLKRDFAVQHAALVGPVQTRVAERAQAFGAERGCGELKMARKADLDALRTAAAQDVSAEFIAWYAADAGS